MSEKKKGRTEIIVFPDWCKGCGICVSFCPAGVLELSENGKARVARPKECANCGFCELHCPDFAILLRPLDMANGKNGLHPLNGGNGGGATRTQAR